VLEIEPPIPCALAGSVLVKGKLTGEAFLSASRQHGLELSPINHMEEPALAAVRLAIRLAERSENSPNPWQDPQAG